MFNNKFMRDIQRKIADTNENSISISGIAILFAAATATFSCGWNLFFGGIAGIIPLFLKLLAPTLFATPFVFKAMNDNNLYSNQTSITNLQATGTPKNLTTIVQLMAMIDTLTQEYKTSVALPEQVQNRINLHISDCAEALQSVRFSKEGTLVSELSFTRKFINAKGETEQVNVATIQQEPKNIEDLNPAPAPLFILDRSGKVAQSFKTAAEATQILIKVKETAQNTPQQKI